MPQQWAAVSVLVIKPAYMLGSFVLILLLRRRHDPSLVSLRWSLTAFLAGEGACAIESFIVGRSVLLNYLHGYGMAVAFALAVFSLLSLLDRRVVRYGATTKGCALSAQCRECIKRASVPCLVRRVFALTAAALGVVAAIPLWVSITPIAYETLVLDTPVPYSHSTAAQLFELRFLPVISMAALWISAPLYLRYKAEGLRWAMVLLSAGVGGMGFTYFRLTLVSALRPVLLWKVFWEETSELLFVAAVWTALVLLTTRPRQGALSRLLLRPTEAANGGKGA